MPKAQIKPPSKPKRGTKSGGQGVIYARYSSHNQKDISIEQQVDLCKVLAKECGIKIVDTYADRAVSGKSDKRPEFQRMMKEAAKGKFQYVISWKSSRIGRNMLEAMMNECRLQEAGVRILYCEEDFDDTAAGRFAQRSMMNVNQFYIENLAEDIRRGMISNAGNCLANGPAPFGYKTTKDLHYVIDSPKDEIVREIYRRVAHGDKFVDIYEDLNSRGIKTSKGNQWGRSSFNTLIKNEKYRGVYIYDNIKIEGGMPRIVSDELFYKVQEVLKTKKNAQGRHRANGDYLLTGKLFCGNCGNRMVGMSGTGKNGQLHYYYICKGKKQCHKKNVQRDKIELSVAQAIKDYILKDNVIEWVADLIQDYQKKHIENSDYAILQDQLKSVDISIKNIMDAIEKGIFTTTTKDRLLELEAQQRDIKAKAAAIKSDCLDIPRDHVITWMESFRDGSVEDKEYQSKLFNSFLSSVYLYDDKLKIVFSMSETSSVDIDLLNSCDSDLNEMDCVRISSGALHHQRDAAPNTLSIPRERIFMLSLQKSFW